MNGPRPPPEGRNATPRAGVLVKVGSTGAVERAGTCAQASDRGFDMTSGRAGQSDRAGRMCVAQAIACSQRGSPATNRLGAKEPAPAGYQTRQAFSGYMLAFGALNALANSSKFWTRGVVPLPPPGGAGRSPFTRTSHGQLRASFESVIWPHRTRALAAAATAGFLAAAAVAEGSAKAITASPSTRPKLGLPPKP